MRETPGDPRFTRALTADERAQVERARQKALTLYEGKLVPHRSCGIALAETFGLATASYQSLRRGGITGCGECGAIKAGELVLGEILGDPDPTGPVTPELRAAAAYYRERWSERLELGPGAKRRESEASAGTPPSVGIICNDLTSPFGDFHGESRHTFCTQLAAGVAELVAETLVRLEALPEITPIADLREASK